MENEQLRITEAWEYFKNKTNIEIERRAFFSYIEDEGVTINQVHIDLTANQINKTWFIARHKIDALIAAMKP